MKYIQYLWMCCIGLCLFACTEADELKTTEGKTGFLVSLKEETVGVEARTIPKDLPAPMKTDFTIRILNARTCEEVKNVQCTGDNQLIDVGVGIYNVVAEYGDGSAVSLDAPYYKGVVENQRVNDGKATLVTVNCKVANALLSISYDESNLKFTDVYEEGYYIKVVANGKPVVIKDIEKSAYFPAGASFDVYFCAVKKGETEEKEIKLNVEYNTLNPADHLTLFLSPEPEKYEVPLSITKMEIQQISINETIPMGWLPKPKVTATGFDSNNTLAFVETEQMQAALNLDLSSALQDIKFKFNFEDEQFASLEKEKEYLLSTDKETIEQALGITLPSIGDKPESIDLSGLIAKLQTNAGVPTNNSIEIDVQANNRWSSDAIEGNSAPNLTYTLTCNKPEFSVSVKPENCWAWEFTVDEVTVTSGDAEKIKSNLVYQYYDGTDWVDCNNGLTQRFTKDENRKYVYLTDNPEPRTYRVRALYRGEILSNNETVATLEEPWQLPNSDMEEWYYEMAARNIPIYYPWSNGGSSFWNTNNTYTTRYHASINIFNSGSNPYNCFPAVSYVVGGHSGNRAVELRNTASGRGNTLPSNVLDLNKVAGELFIGDITVTTGGTAAIPSGDHYTIDTNGRNFPSRPSSLEFWYKYIPTNSDTWQAKIVLMDSEHNVIIEQNLQKTENQENWAKATLELGYTNEQIYAKCQYIYIVFSSTITTGNAMQWEEHGSYILWEDQSQVIFDDTKCWVGSVLTIDNISLGYNK